MGDHSGIGGVSNRGHEGGKGNQGGIGIRVEWVNYLFPDKN